jgi:hypothetical protein
MIFRLREDFFLKSKNQHLLHTANSVLKIIYSNHMSKDEKVGEPIAWVPHHTGPMWCT